MRGAAGSIAIARAASLGCALLAGACLEIGDSDPPMCDTTADCDDGEICEEHVCWGNPPAGPFAAVISPPSERGGSLVSRELIALPISSDGWIEDIHLPSAVTFQGRLQSLCEAPLICDDRRLGATITISRPSRFEGGPGFRKVITVEAGQDAFELNVPPTEPGDPAYTVTVVPNGRDAPDEVDSLARQVPPLRTSDVLLPVSITGNVIELGGIDLPRVSGLVTTSTGTPLANYRVVAIGRWDAEMVPTEVSTVDFTGPDGLYELTLSRGLVGDVELVAKPVGAPLRPSLHLGSIPGNANSTNKVLTRPTATPANEIATEIIVTHTETGGEVTRVAGARVAITSSVTTGNSASAKLAVEGTTDDHGSVTLKLLDGDPLSASYKLSIIPPPNSKASALFEAPYRPAPQTTQRLGTRIALSGTVKGEDDSAVKDVSVTVRPSLRFLWSLEPGPQAFLGAIPAATVATPNSGVFVLFVDHSLETVTNGQPGTVWGHYDLAFEPAATSRSPGWLQPEIELPRDASQESVKLGTTQLPDAAFVRGHVFDANGAPLEGAEVKLYRVRDGDTLCRETRFHPSKCVVPAEIVGRGASDAAGVVRLTLPR
jgi:hypothetical protein